MEYFNGSNDNDEEDGEDKEDEEDGEDHAKDDDGDVVDDDLNHLVPCQAWCRGWCPPAEPSSSTCAHAFESSTSRCGPRCLAIK